MTEAEHLNPEPARTGITAGRTDRAVGTLVGTACGDALGAGYEFGRPLSDDTEVRMGGGPNSYGWAPGEWTDDTSMAIPLARVAGRGGRFDEATLDEVVAAWKGWAEDARDVGVQTRTVLSACDGTAASARAVSRKLHERTGRTGGNGSLMRTAPVALAYLADGQERELADAARRVSELTHADPDAGDACVIWTAAIRHAVRTASLDVRVGLPLLDPEAATRWSARLDEAEHLEPRDFARNGWVVEALQAAWSAIVNGDGVVDTLERAVRGGRDTDTVAAIAGGLVGAVHGGSAFPAAWRRILHGWPSLRVRDLTELAVLATRGGHPDAMGWPAGDRFPAVGASRVLVRHPDDDRVWMTSLARLADLPDEVDAVISLCRVGRRETELETVEFWLVDQPGANPNLEFVVGDAADTIAALRAEGRTVAVHCFEARSRTAVVSAAYAVRHRGVAPADAMRRVVEALPEGNPIPEFRALIARMRG